MFILRLFFLFFTAMAAPGGKDKFVAKLPDGFEIKVEAGENITFVNGVAVSEWIVCANGFMVGHFVNDFCMIMYINYLQQTQFKHFPKKIMNLIREFGHHNQLGVQAIIKGEVKK